MVGEIIIAYLHFVIAEHSVAISSLQMFRKGIATPPSSARNDKFFITFHSLPLGESRGVVTPSQTFPH